MIFRPHIPLLLLAGLLAGCEGPSPTGSHSEDALSPTVLSSDDRTALQGAALEDSVRVRATGPDQRPRSGVQVRAIAFAGGGVVEPATAITGADGIASFAWTLGEEYDQRLRLILASAPEIRTEISAASLYRYRSPEHTGDGWLVAALDTTSSYAKLLWEAVDGIRSGATAGVHSLLVVHKDSLRFEAYWPGLNSAGIMVQFGRTVPHEMQSASKSYRSALIGIAIDQGFIRGPEQPIAEFFPDKAHLFDDDKRRITLGDVLTMRSGLDWDETGAAQGNSNNTLSQMYLLPASEWTNYVLSRPMAFEPGERFVYNTGASIMLADILERASGMSMNGFVRAHYSNAVQSPGMITSGVQMTPRDMARLGQVFLREGMWKGTPVVSREWVQESLQEHVQVTGALGYGYQWWMTTVSGPAGTYRARYANGNGGQIVLLVDELDLVVVATGGNFGSSGTAQIFPLLQSAVLGIAGA